MIVVIEGADGTGKTTLARAVTDRLGAAYLHAGPPELHPLVSYTAPLEPLADRIDVVCDRWHLGELVYGPLYRGGPGLTDCQFGAVEDYLLAKGAVLVHCTGRSRDIARRLDQRGEDFLQPADLNRCLNLFDKAVLRSRLPRLTSVVGMEVTPDEVVAFAREETKCA